MRGVVGVYGSNVEVSSSYPKLRDQSMGDSEFSQKSDGLFGGDESAVGCSSKVILPGCPLNSKPNELRKLPIRMKLSKLFRYRDFNLIEPYARQVRSLDFLCHTVRDNKARRAFQKLVPKPSIKLIMELVNDCRPSGRSVEDCVLSPTTGNLGLDIIEFHCPPPTGGINREPYFA